MHSVLPGGVQELHFTRVAADDRLDALPDSGKDCHKYECDISKDTVCRKSGRSAEFQSQHVEDKNYDAGR